MACKYKYNDKWFTENELIYLIGEKKNLLDISNKQALERLNSLQEVFKQSSELQSIGTIFDYDSYLNTIFPDSKVKDIKQHSTEAEFESFTKEGSGRLGKGFYFSDFGNNYIEGENVKKKLVLLNIKNPLNIQGGQFMKDVYKLLDDRNQSSDDTDAKIQAQKDINNQYKQKADALIGDKNGVLNSEIKVFESEQIHILGSKQDIEGFKSFIKSNTKTVRKGAITPSIKGHAQFSTDKGIGWFRSDDRQKVRGTDIYTKKQADKDLKEGKISQFEYEMASETFDKESLTETDTKTRRILEVQSDLFQKGRDKDNLTATLQNKGDQFVLNGVVYDTNIKNFETGEKTYTKRNENFGWDKITKEEYEQAKEVLNKENKENQFLQLLNKDNNWVTFFIKSIIQDSAKQTITEVQESDVEAKVRELEKEGLLEIDCKGKIKAEKGLQTNFTKGGKWKLIKDLKGYPTHKEGGVDLTISKNGVSIKNGNTEFTAKHGLVIPKN